jgi:hypothetical protein
VEDGASLCRQQDAPVRQAQDIERVLARGEQRPVPPRAAVVGLGHGQLGIDQDLLFLGGAADGGEQRDQEQQKQGCRQQMLRQAARGNPGGEVVAARFHDRLTMVLRGRAIRWAV